MILNITVDGQRHPPRTVEPKVGELVPVDGKWAMIETVTPRDQGQFDLQCTFIKGRTKAKLAGAALRESRPGTGNRVI